MAATTISTTAPSAHTFDPATWLDNFKSVGGGWMTGHDGTTSMGFFVAGNSCQNQRAARDMLNAITDDQRRDLDAYICQTKTGKMAALSSDVAVMHAWEHRKAAFQRYNALPIADDTDPTYDADDQLTDAERHEWSIINDAEAAMVAATVTTQRAVAAILWTALSSSLTDRAQEEAATKGDLAAMMAFDVELEWNERLILSALRSLKAMEAQ